MAYGLESGIVATGSRDNKLRLWSLKQLALIHTFDEVQDCMIRFMSYVLVWITAIFFVNKESEIVTTGGDYVINIFNVKDLKLSKVLNIEADIVTNAQYSETHNLFVAASSNLIKIWTTKDWTPLKTFNTKQEGFITIGILDGSTLAMGGDGSLKIWNFEKEEYKISFKQYHKDEITGLLITSDKKKAISTSKDGSIRIWDIEHRKLDTEIISAHGGGR
jgi:WD40 repeat protein